MMHTRLFLVVTMFIFSLGANAQQADFQSTLSSFLPIIVLFGIFYFLLIRPQSKKMKEHKRMVQNLSPDDSIIVAGGIAGCVLEVGDSFLKVLIADHVLVNVQKESVVAVLPKGTFSFASTSEK